MIEILWAVLFVLALLSVLANAASLAQGVRLRTRVRAGLRLGFGAYAPQTAVVLPVRGTDEGLRENVAAILSQAHPAFRVLVVADDGSDAAVAVVRDVSSSLPHVRVDVIRADPDGMGGKVNALRTALDRLEPGDEAVVFADADIRPSRDWLHQLLQPLADPSVGASTGFRWYVPPRPAVWALVRAEWNAVSANVLFDPRRSFAWGGSCAVRREDLLRLRLGERWRSVLSDDLVLTRAVREAGLRIEYAPAALVATHEGGDRAMCLEWCLRQMTMASLYLPVVRTYATAAFAVFDGAIVLGIASLVLAALVKAATSCWKASWSGVRSRFMETEPARASRRPPSAGGPSSSGPRRSRPRGRCPPSARRSPSSRSPGSWPTGSCARAAPRSCGGAGGRTTSGTRSG